MMSFFFSEISLLSQNKGSNYPGIQDGKLQKISWVVHSGSPECHKVSQHFLTYYETLYLSKIAASIEEARRDFGQPSVAL